MSPINIKQKNGTKSYSCFSFLGINLCKYRGVLSISVESTK